MLTYIKEWIKDCNSTTKEMNDMGYFTISTWFGSYTYVDREMYKEYHDRQKQISRHCKQIKE
jgi:hypothetical protein